MMRIERLFISLACLCFSSLAFSKIEFGDYATEKAVPSVGHIYVQGKEGSAGQYWDELRKRMSLEPPNFAGHFTVYVGGCGGGAICGEIIDAETGKLVSSLPSEYKLGGENPEEEFGLDFNRESRLMIIWGVALSAESDEHGNPLGFGYRTRYYEFDGDSFKLLKVE